MPGMTDSPNQHHNPVEQSGAFAEAIVECCCASCVRGESDRTYYTALKLNPQQSPTTDEVKKAYKKVSLSVHPDKLLQRGIEITAEHKQEFMLAKEAYEVLSDPHRRRLYDKFGKTGLKIIESPQEVNPLELLKNFQRNKGDRCALVLLIGFCFAAILVFPILLCLKSDNTVGSNVTWADVMIPMWIFDGFLLLISFSLLCSKEEDMKEDAKHEGYDRVSNASASKSPTLTAKLIYLSQTLLFILLQILVVAKLDGNIDIIWMKVMAAWIAHEFVVVLENTPGAFVSIASPSDASHPAAVLLEEEEKGLLSEVFCEVRYVEQMLDRAKHRRTLWTSLLRIWQAIFMALKLDHSVSWNWGLVFLPLWISIITSWYSSSSLSNWSSSVEESASRDLPEIKDLKLAHAHLIQAYSQSICCFQIFVAIIAVLLVLKLQHVASYSAFIILLPIFITIGCICCAVYCSIFAYATVDPEEIPFDRQSFYGTFASESTRSNAANV